MIRKTSLFTSLFLLFFGLALSSYSSSKMGKTLELRYIKEAFSLGTSYIKVKDKKYLLMPSKDRALYYFENNMKKFQEAYTIMYVSSEKRKKSEIIEY